MSDDSWQDLYGQWKDSLGKQAGQAPQQPGHWFSIWRMIVGHPWFQQQLCDAVRYEIRVSNLPRDLAGDLEQEVILLLAGKLARQRDLGMDVELAEQKFPAFLGTVVRNACRQAARKLRRQFQRAAALPAPQRVADRHDQRKSLVNLSLEIEELDDPWRTILLLKMKGTTLKQIAQQLQMNYSRVRREFHRACRQLSPPSEHAIPK